MQLILGVLVGAVLGSVSYFYLAHDLLLAVWTAIVWFVGVSALVKLPPSAKAYARQGGAIGGASVAIMVGATLLGVSPYLPVSLELRMALQWLVLGVGFASWSVALYLVSRSLGKSSGNR